MKPHDSWLILFYFFLAGGVFLKRARQTLAIAAALTLLSFLWVSHLVPNWPHELHSNLASSAAPGGRDDPGPSTNGGQGLIAWCALMLNVLAILFTGDAALRIFFIFTHNSPKGLAEASLLGPPALAATGLLYLWAHLFHSVSEETALEAVPSDRSRDGSSLS